MTYRLLELHFAQLSKTWGKSKYNNYSDTRKKAYHDQLGVLYKRLKTEDFSQYQEREIIARYKVIDFIFKSLEFLNTSTLNVTPFEIVTCLEAALNDWIEVDDNYIVVTSLVNRMNDFSFDPSLAINDSIYEHIKILYDLEFNTRLIQINLPASLIRDYLANVVLYHELGHFIDMKYEIMATLCNELYDAFTKKYLSKEDLINLDYYFPFLQSGTDEQDKLYMLDNHLSEYFCDIFASQYIHDSTNHYLNYITNSETGFSYTHPQTSKRIEMVNQFLKGDSSNFTLNKIREATSRIFNETKTLDIKYQQKRTEDFIHLIPIDIENKQQLHYLFVHGWELWLNDWSIFEKQNSMNFRLNREKVYDIINSLIEKSIGNYIVKTNWEIAKSHVPS